MWWNGIHEGLKIPCLHGLVGSSPTIGTITPQLVSFTRTIENFTCEHCGKAVTGNGYTNHCPHCLWSKHVDREPGDRAAECKGMMRPTAVDVVGGEYAITHTCERCGHIKKNKTSPDDSIETLVQVMKNK
jgi:hypothetical protein